MQIGYAELFKRALVVVAAAVTPLLIWYLFPVILITFGAVILATLLRLGAEPLRRWFSLRESLALLLSALLLLLDDAGFLFQTRIAGQLQDVVQRAGDAAASLETSLRSSQIGKLVLTHIGGPSLSLPSVLEVSSNLLGGLVILVVAGIYLAVQPNLYRQGMIQLFPPRAHARIAEIVDEIANALRLWLLGQLIQMVAIGAVSTLSVLIIGVPAPFALGLIAAVGEFIPFFGPLISAVPAILVAMTKSTEAALWTGVAYLIIHQVEGNLLVPLIQRHLVFIPPAVILLGIVALTFRFGPIAIIIAAPITVVIFVAVKVAYVRDSLGEATRIPEQAG